MPITSRLPIWKLLRDLPGAGEVLARHGMAPGALGREVTLEEACRGVHAAYWDVKRDLIELLGVGPDPDADPMDLGGADEGY